MAKYSPADVLRKFVLRKNIEHLVYTSEHAVWFNLTFWENVTSKAFATKCWDKLSKAIVKQHPDFRLVGIWARQRRGAWHIHAVCNQRFDLAWLQRKAMRCGFGEQFFLRELDEKKETPQKIARYISGYVTDKNGLDKEKDKGVRRMIFVGQKTRVMDMRFKSALKKVTSMGREISDSVSSDEYEQMNEFQRQFSAPSGRKKIWESWGEWYRRNRDYWFDVGWRNLSVEEKSELYDCDEFLQRYLDDGRWSYV